jgi:hypothetical protein
MSSNILLFLALKLNCGLKVRILRRENVGGREEFEQKQNLNPKNERRKGRGGKKKMNTEKKRR